MKTIHRFSSALKVAGIVLILLSLVLGLYALINTGSTREMLDQGMTRFGASARWNDFLSFDRHFFSALSRSVGNRDRKEEERLTVIDPDFRSWFDRMEDSARSEEAEARRMTAEWLKAQDPESLGLNSMEEQQENREIREIFEYIDGLAAPPKKGKLASLKPASQEPFFRESSEAFAGESG